MDFSAFAATPSVIAKSVNTTKSCILPSRYQYTQSKTPTNLRYTSMLPVSKSKSFLCCVGVGICLCIREKNNETEVKMMVTSTTTTLSPGEQAIADLMTENEAFARGEAKIFPGVPEEVTRLAVEGQTPSVAIIACSDSRTAPEIMFRTNVGELFVVRTAGNTAWGDEALGSLEFAINVLKVKGVLVVGHTKCGAITAAVGGAELPGALGQHIKNIQKVLMKSGGIINDVDYMCEVNVRAQIEFLRSDPDGAVAQGEKNGLAVRGALYDTTTGKARLL